MHARTLAATIIHGGPRLSVVAGPQQDKLEAAEEAFKQSDTLKKLLEKSEANKEKNKKDILNK